MNNVVIRYYCDDPDTENLIKQITPTLPLVIEVTATQQKPNGKVVSTVEKTKAKLEYNCEQRFCVPVGTHTVKLGKFKTEISLPDDRTAAYILATIGKTNRWAIATEYRPAE